MLSQLGVSASGGDGSTGLLTGPERRRGRHRGHRHGVAGDDWMEHAHGPHPPLVDARVLRPGCDDARTDDVSLPDVAVDVRTLTRITLPSGKPAKP